MVIECLQRKYINLIYKESSQWVNWDPPIGIKVGSYGTFDRETGNFLLQGSIYDPEFQEYLSRQGVNMNLTECLPQYGLEEDNLIITTSGVKHVDTDLGRETPGLAGASLRGHWSIQSGKPEAILVVYRPQLTLLPQNVWERLYKLDKLIDRWLITSTHTCPAFCMYYSQKTGGNVSLALVSQGPISGRGGGLRWCADTPRGFIRNACDKRGGYLYTPLFTARRANEQEFWDYMREIISPDQSTPATGENESVTPLDHSLEVVSTEKADPEEAIESLDSELSPIQDTVNKEKTEVEKTIESLLTLLKQTVQELRDELGSPQLAAAAHEESKETVTTPDEKIANIELTIQELSASQSVAIQDRHALYQTMEVLRLQDRKSNAKIARLMAKLENSQRETDRLTQIIRAHEQMHECERLYDDGHLVDATTSLLSVSHNLSEEIKSDKFISDWFATFTSRCIKALERNGDQASEEEAEDDAISTYSAALLLGPSDPKSILVKWARLVLVRRTPTEALGSATKFQILRLNVYQAVCDILGDTDRIAEAMECFRQMGNELVYDVNMHDEHVQWELDFRRRCAEKLEKRGDIAVDSRNHNDAIEYYSDALEIGSSNQINVFLKRGKAHVFIQSWQETLMDANKVIELDPLSPKGYEMKYIALQGMKHYSEAFRAFTVMLSNLEKSSNPSIHQLDHPYFDPTTEIQKTIWKSVIRMPRVLIDTTTGRLCDKRRIAAAFEQLPIYDELRCSMTIRLDEARVRKEVQPFYRYVMFSHRWDDGEPLFQDVENISVYKLELTFPNIKLQTLCKLVRSLGFRWVWSDTCCIDKKDNVVLQESLVAMFAWYRASSLTVVYLRGVWSESQQRGHLKRSIWNTRTWTYQEYVAAKVVQFYTEDWKPYLGLDMFNHKESLIVISEMGQVSGLSAQTLAILRPGLESVREKLFLASVRHTTLVEDAAYSLLGIFNVTIPVIYGEGNRAVGRLLEHILTRSGNAMILAWTGRAGDYSSCLPPNLKVYRELVPPHIPQPAEAEVMDQIVTALRSSLPQPSLAVKIYDRLNGLPSPSFALGRLQLPGLVFPVIKLVRLHEPDSEAESESFVYRPMTTMLEDVEIETTEDLSGMRNLILIHPWTSALLDQEFSEGAAALDATTCALRLVARVMQPFGALLLAPVSRIQYRRVAADRLIMVQIRRDTSLDKLADSIRTVDVQ